MRLSIPHRLAARRRGALVLFAAALFVSAGCAPRAMRGGEGTDNPDLDRPALSVTLDRVALPDRTRPGAPPAGRLPATPGSAGPRLRTLDTADPWR